LLNSNIPPRGERKRQSQKTQDAKRNARPKFNANNARRKTQNARTQNWGKNFETKY